MKQHKQGERVGCYTISYSGVVRVSAQAMCLYSQPTQARNPVRSGSSPSYHSESNYERKDSCSQRPRLLHLHIYTH